ncbi:MAG: phosphotransferase [Streptosporangiales bacterium]|nr:phosphotransferase [Streptosporangiales bacterium]
MSTHELRLGPSAVTKAYRWTDRDQPLREWRGLRLLHRYAPGLAPEPLSAEFDVIPPTVTMSRLPGSPVTGSVTGPLAGALAAAITRLHDAVPAPELAALPPRAGAPEGLLTHVRTWHAETPPPDADLLARAYAAGGDWLARPGTERDILRPGRPVFGTGDGNVHNFLWDGATVRVVDLEYCGRSDRPYEIAEVVEHISAWDNDPRGLTEVLARLPLDPAETERLTQCRRLFALYWFLRVLPEAGSPDSRAEATARRLLALL